MSQQGSGFDVSKPSTGDKVVLGGAGVFFIWTFIPVWYKFSAGVAGMVVFSDSKNGWAGLTWVAAIMSIIALAEIALKILNVKMSLPVKRGLIHLGVAGIALLFTLLGLVSKPTLYGMSWGLFVAIVIALVWVYGAYMMYSEPEAAAPPAPPAPPAP
jgi:uncharacterized membrane protein